MRFLASALLAITLGILSSDTSKARSKPADDITITSPATNSKVTSPFAVTGTWEANCPPPAVVVVAYDAKGVRVGEPIFATVNPNGTWACPLDLPPGAGYSITAFIDGTLIDDSVTDITVMAVANPPPPPIRHRLR